jgi:hypothetical protein
MAPPQSRSRITSHFEDAVTDYLADPVTDQHRGTESIAPGWGNIRKDNVPVPNIDHGWGSIPKMLLHLHRVITTTLTQATSRHDMARTLLKRVRQRGQASQCPAVISIGR